MPGRQGIRKGQFDSQPDLHPRRGGAMYWGCPPVGDGSLFTPIAAISLDHTAVFLVLSRVAAIQLLGL